MPTEVRLPAESQPQSEYFEKNTVKVVCPSCKDELTLVWYRKHQCDTY